MKIVDAPAQQQATDDVEAKYPALRTISLLLNIVAVVVLIICILIGISLFFTMRGGMGFAVGAGVMAVGAIQWLLFKATAESIVVLVDIERNTRIAAACAQAGKSGEKS